MSAERRNTNKEQQLVMREISDSVIGMQETLKHLKESMTEVVRMLRGDGNGDKGIIWRLNGLGHEVRELEKDLKELDERVEKDFSVIEGRMKDQEERARKRDRDLPLASVSAMRARLKLAALVVTQIGAVLLALIAIFKK